LLLKAETQESSNDSSSTIQALFEGFQQKKAPLIKNITKA
jgi:hypothetical protein